MACGLVNLGSCLPEKFFEFIQNILNAPIQPFLELTLNLLSEPITLDVFISLWVIIVYMLSMFYALLLVASGMSFMISGHDVSKRENAKTWLRNVVIMIVLVQASFFIYQLFVDLSASMTSATLSLIDESFFLITIDEIGDLGLSILLTLATSISKASIQSRQDLKILERDQHTNKMVRKLGFVNTFVYVVACVMTFGALWVLKITIQKAIVDSHR